MFDEKFGVWDASTTIPPSIGISTVSFPTKLDVVLADLSTSGVIGA